MNNQKADVVQKGMGAIVHTSGAAFRVWAPHAQAVFAKGEFNNWSGTATPLAHEANGYWYADVESAKPGQEYKFVLINGDRKLERIDPFAKQVTNSTGNGVIEIGMPTTGLWKLRLNSDATIYSNDFQGFFSSDVEAVGDPKDGLDARASVSIGPYSMLIFSQAV